jgi:rubrerythrin
MNIYRCSICGDPYLGREKPTNCSSCGVPAEYLALARDWKEKEVQNLSSISRKNLERALEAELKNNTFYTASSRKSKNPELKAMFWALSKIAAEHAKIVNKILKKAAPRYVEDTKVYPADDKKCLSTDEENIKEIREREESAVKFYNQAAEEAKEERVKEIFEALSKVKSEYIKLSEIK